MFKISILKPAAVGAAFMLALGVSAHAQTGTDIFNQTSPNTRFGWYVDFASTTIAGHFSQPVGTAAPINGLKYHFVQLNTQSGTSDASCFELTTTRPDFLPQTPVTDTRIWFANAANNFNDESLNDDFNGTLFSAARFYMVGFNAFVNLKIAAYSTTYNTGHFKIYVTRLPLGEASCTTNSGMAWVAYKNGVMTSHPQ